MAPSKNDEISQLIFNTEAYGGSKSELEVGKVNTDFCDLIESRNDGIQIMKMETYH